MRAVFEHPSVLESQAKAAPEPRDSAIPTLAVVTLVLWAGCLFTGILGVVFPYSRPLPPPPEAPPVEAQMIQVQLSDSPLPVPAPQSTPQSLAQPPPLSAPPVAPSAPPVTAVADPALVAFALPVEGPVAVVEPKQADFAPVSVPEPKAPVAAPPVQTLVYGRGEGVQPRPDYPLRAKREGQEGVVRVRFLVGEDGRVTSAEAVQRCPWDLLNDSALRVIRERWRFQTGPLRHYEVAIRFQLSK